MITQALPIDALKNRQPNTSTTALIDNGKAPKAADNMKTFHSDKKIEIRHSLPFRYHKIKVIKVRISVPSNANQGQARECSDSGQ